MGLLSSTLTIGQFLAAIIKIATISLAYWVTQQSLDRLIRRAKDGKEILTKTFYQGRHSIDFFFKFFFLVTLLHILFGDFSSFTPFKTKDLIKIVGLGVVAWFLNISIGTAANHYVEDQKEKYDPTAVQTFTKIARAAIIIFIGLSLLSVMGIDTSGILTLGAAGSVVIGFASKDWLSNFFGGLMIYIDKPFGVGDWIKCPDKDIEGTVMSIGWRLTNIRTLERRPLYVPNSFFAQTAIENLSRMENRRIKHFINLPYKDFDKIPGILDDISTMLRNSSDIDNEKPIYVHITQLAASSVECMVYCFTKYTEMDKFLLAQQHVMVGILKIINEYETTYGLPVSQVIIQHVDK